MTLSNNFKIDSNSSGYPLRFVYLAYSGRFQAYLGRDDPITGQFDPEWKYLDEINDWLSTRKEGQTLAYMFETSGETPDDMEFP